jgi:hypothetical protein
MYAPTYPSIWIKREIWHRVNPLHLVHPVCSSATVLRGTMMRDELPEGVEYCVWCRTRHGAVLAANHGQGVVK